MKRSLASSLLLATTLAAAPPPPATHVVAVSGEVPVSVAPDFQYSLASPDVTAAAPGEFVVAWTSSYSIYRGSQEVGFGSGVSGRKVGLHAQPLAPEFPVEPVTDAFGAENPSVAGNASGRFVVSWELTDSNFTSDRSQFFVRLRRFGADARPLGDRVNLYTSAVGNLGREAGGLSSQPVAMDPAGRSAIAWLQPLPTAADGAASLRAQIFDPAGTAVTARFPVTGRTQAEAFPALAMDGRGNSIVVYRSSQVAPGGATGIYLRRYDAKGRPLGGEVQVVPPAGQNHPKVAASAAGSFVVVWSELAKGVRAQLFDAAGQPAGAAFRVAAHPQPNEDLPDVAMDSRGSFVVVWAGADADFTHITLLGRAFSRTGVPQGDEIEVPSTPVGGQPTVALAENGTFLVTWASGESGSPTNQISARAFRALSNRDRCVYRYATFICGTATGDLSPLLRLGNGTAAGDVPLLADVDGDGADDPCIRRGAAFSCALSASAGTVQVFPFGAASHVPLLGDVNGDGRADPCVRRGRFFLCDTAHDGGLAEVKIPFGLADDPALLGDVDGDGRADPCVFREGQFLCDTSHDGVRDLVQPEDVQAGDAPLLGDANGDGRADFCVIRGTALLCDLVRNGRLTAQPLALQPGDVVLLGKVDRL
jgi:hypothetical protein